MTDTKLVAKRLEEAVQRAVRDTLEWSACAVCALCRDGNKPVRRLMGEGWPDEYRHKVPHGWDRCRATPIHRRLSMEEE